MARNCGECTMCCKILGVTELNKAPNVWCQHCAIGTGCRIYEQRPESCRQFECNWLQEDWIPDELRPDKSKVVISSTADGEHPVFWVDPGYPDAWRRPAMLRFINACKSIGAVLAIGNQRRLITENGISNVVHQAKDGLYQIEVSDNGAIREKI